MRVYDFPEWYRAVWAALGLFGENLVERALPAPLEHTFPLTPYPRTHVHPRPIPEHMFTVPDNPEHLFVSPDRATARTDVCIIGSGRDSNKCSDAATQTNVCIIKNGGG